MRLDHLMQAYNFNKIPAKIKDRLEENGERAGIITFYNGITGSYLLDDEDVVVAMKVFCNCLAGERTAQGQLSHTAKVINVIQKTIMALDNVSEKEVNMALDKLGLFDGTFKESKQIKHLEHLYRVEVIDGLLCLTVEEIINTPA